MDNIPTSFEELQEEAQKAIKVLDETLAVPIPASVKDAVSGRFMESGKGIIETALGHTPPGEMEEWGRRVIPLKKANDILRAMENDLVKAFVLSPAAPARIIIDGLLLIPKWIVGHAAEIGFIIWPLLSGAFTKLSDIFSIERRIDEIDRRTDFLRKEIRDLYSVTPRPPRRAGLPELPYYPGQQPTAKQLEQGIKGDEAEIAVLEREREALAKLSAAAGSYLDRAAVAVSVMLVWFSVQKLIQTAKSVSESLVTFSPAKKLREAAIEEIKSAALPQARIHRVLVKKRSRRN